MKLGNWRGPAALLAAALAAACVDSSESSGSRQPATESGLAVVAHRGGSAYAPENTMTAIANAYRLGVDEIEIDVLYSADDELVIFHDDTLERTTDCEGTVGATSLAALRDCDAAFWFQPGQPVTVPDEAGPHPLRGRGITIPTLREFFIDALARGEQGPLLLVEVKSIPGESNFDPVSLDIAQDVVDMTREFGLEERVAVQSFWPLVIDFVKAIAPEIQTRFLTTQDFGQTAAQNTAYVISRDHDGIAPNFDAADFTAEIIELAQAAGKLVVPYTVNQPADMERVAEMGVDGIITDYPACLLRLQGRFPPSRAAPSGVPDIPACP